MRIKVFENFFFVCHFTLNPQVGSWSLRFWSCSPTLGVALGLGTQVQKKPHLSMKLFLCGPLRQKSNSLLPRIGLAEYKLIKSVLYLRMGVFEDG